MAYATTKVYKEASREDNSTTYDVKVTIVDDEITKVTINGVEQVIYEDDYETFTFIHQTLDNQFVTIKSPHPRNVK